MSTAWSATSNDPLPMDGLVGRRVIDCDGQSVGRIQEFRVRTAGADWVITHYVIGVAGLLERLGVGLRLLLGAKTSGYLARADQVDVSDPERARLTCSRDDLGEL
jgi:hypothetical protein